MKALLKTVFRVLLWGLLLALVLAGLYLLCMLFDLPKGLVAASAALLLALIIAIVLTRRILTRRRRYQQIQNIVNLAPESIADSNADSRLIENRWNRAVAIMRESYLGRWGNPLYALPWYMVMGKTGAGKSSSIRNSGLSAMQTDVGPEEIGASTRNCDWHFFREAVVIDTAGRYSIPLNEAEDSAEWREFLARLARYRRREPLNGLVLSVAADTLHGSGEHLLSEARCLRRRIDEIMRILGEKFPIYLMVTKIDLPSGMARFLETLSETSKKQCLGIFIQSPEKKNLLPVEAQIVQATNALTERMRNFFLYSDSSGPEQAPSPHRILAWEELKAMMPALRAYADEVFAANPYQETPLLRGIFFSSALRGQQEGSRAFPALSALARKVFRVQDSVGGMFLHDFFGKVLPEDRTLHRPIAEYLRWRSSIRAVAYGAMLLATFGLSTLFFLSYQHNYQILDTMAHPRSVVPEASLSSRLLTFEQRFRDAAQLEKKLGLVSPQPLIFDHTKDAFYAYEKSLSKDFYRDVLRTALVSLDEKRGRLTSDTDDKVFFTLVSDLIWRYDLMDAVSKGKSFEELLQIPAMPQGIMEALGLGDTPQLTPSVAYSVARYIFSVRDPVEQEQMLQSMRTVLMQLPEIKAHSLHWIVHRAGTLSTLLPVRGEEFWPSHQDSLLRDVALDPVFTSAGLAVTLEYLDNLNLIFADDALKPSTANFMRWYASNYSQAWQQFAHDFAQKTATLATLPASGEAVSAMSTSRNAYFSVLMRMDLELSAIRNYLEPPPPWLEDLELFAQSLRLVAREHPENENLTLVQRLKGNARNLYDEINDAVKSEARERDMKAQVLAKDIQAYLDSLRELVRFTTNNSLAFNAVKDAMPHENNQNAPKAVITLAATATHAMNASLNPNPAQNSPIYPLVTGPMNFFRQRLMNGAACQIQAMWEGDVLTKAGRLAPSQLQQGLFAAQGGIVRDFSDTTLAFFLNHTLNGYEPETIAGHPIPFTPDFVSFLNAGIEQYRPVRDEYTVTLDALPADVNGGAFETPYSVELALYCAREKQEFVNYNSPASTRINWQRGACGDTRLTIHFKTVTLEVLYVGENGFLNFLSDFQYGAKVFNAKDFPEQADALGKLGISEIRVRYRLSGAEDILSGHRFAPGTLPFVAVECKR
jgi:Uncharacterized protein conserved in bacteria